jgi:hypothetical protein
MGRVKPGSINFVSWGGWGFGRCILNVMLIVSRIFLSSTPEVFEIVCRMMGRVNPGFINFVSWGGWDCGRCFLNVMLILSRISICNTHEVFEILYVE